MKLRSFDPDLYKKLIENSDNVYLQKYISEEIKTIAGIKNVSDKTLIELGAGYGRIWPEIAHECRRLLGIEINPKMYNSLKMMADKYKNSLAIEGDITKSTPYSTIKDQDEVVFLLLQNTLGVVEGDWIDVIKQIKNFKTKRSKELILSTFRSESLETIGMKIYTTLVDMFGVIDLSQSDITSGVVKTEDGYKAKWWLDHEIYQVINQFDAKIVSHKKTELYQITHLKF